MILFFYMEYSNENTIFPDLALNTSAVSSPATPSLTFPLQIIKSLKALQNLPLKFPDTAYAICLGSFLFSSVG